MNKYLWVLVGIMIVWMTAIVNEHSKPSLLDKLKVIYPRAFENLR